MTRGFFMQLVPKSRLANYLEFQVMAAGWNGDASKIVEVGQLSLNVRAQTATFSPSGPWKNYIVAQAFTERPIGVLDSDGLWTRWLLELGARALAGSTHLTRFV